MRYKLIVFDFDGTLADSFPWFLRTINKVAQQYRFRPIAPAEVDTLRSYSGRELMAYLDLPLWKVPLVTTEMRRLMKESTAEIPLFNGVENLLQRLTERGLDTAVVTSNSYDNVCSILGEELAARVQYFECGASLFGKKAKFRKLLHQTGVAPVQVLCIGDEIRDAQAAAALGLDFIGVSWGYTRPDALAPYSSKKLFDTVHEIGDLLCA